MKDARALLLAAGAAAVGALAPNAYALAPLAMDAVMDSSLAEAPGAPSPHATLAPQEFKRPPDAAFEPTAYVADARARVQCVPFARAEAGIDIYGDAHTWWRQAAGRFERAQRPAESAVMVLRGYATSNRGHVAVVREVVSERLVIIDHANWLNSGEVTRNIPVRDVSPNNDWSQVQVWHVPGRHWGARVYRVQGFILGGSRAAAEIAVG